MDLVVPDDKLSLAIGKKGQNVRLASILTGWRIDIHSETKVREAEVRARSSLAAIEGVTTELAETLFREGWRSAAEVASASPDELAGVPGVGDAQNAARLVEAARAAAEIERKRHAEEAARAAEEAARAAAASGTTTEPGGSEERA
jgi:N utilization substance protein A